MNNYEIWKIEKVDVGMGRRKISFKSSANYEDKDFDLMDIFLIYHNIDPEKIVPDCELRIVGKGLGKVLSCNMINKIELIC